jgi:hypothetical protein
MAGRLPLIGAEPAPGYLPFVESHLESLRRDARRLAGDGLRADAAVSDALTDVALRWYWFELLRIRRGRPDPAAAFVDAALTRRCARRPPEPDEIHFEVTVSAVPPARSVATQWSTDRSTIGDIRWWPDPVAPVEVTRPKPSAAVRIARLSTEVPPEPSASLEAVIAWLHAYETVIRYRRIMFAVLAAVALLALVRFRMAVSS